VLGRHPRVRRRPAFGRSCRAPEPSLDARECRQPDRASPTAMCAVRLGLLARGGRQRDHVVHGHRLSTLRWRVASNRRGADRTQRNRGGGLSGKRTRAAPLRIARRRTPSRLAGGRSERAISGSAITADHDVAAPTQGRSACRSGCRLDHPDGARARRSGRSSIQRQRKVADDPRCRSSPGRRRTDRAQSPAWPRG
jgi:hypothetical protein